MKFKILFTAILLLISQNLFAAEAEKSGSLSKHSMSVQFGMNGILQQSDTYELQLLPPDVSYSYEFFDNNLFNFSTSTFYDNIGVAVRDTNFSYRVGQRLDIAMEFKNCCTPYITAGLGVIRNAHHYQTMPVYGIGVLFKLMKKLSLVNEVNVQKVHYQRSDYDILNVSIGVVYNF